MSLEAIVQRCQQIVEDNTFAWAREWKERHPRGGVMGYWPVYTPVEIIHAAGMLPLAVYGGGNNLEVKHADSRLPSFICSIPRTSMELAFTGRLDFLEGLLFHPICDVARNLAQVWRRNFNTGKVDLLYLPQNIVTGAAVHYIQDEYQRLRGTLEEITGKEITKAALKRSLHLYNRQRQLIRELYTIRHEAPWLLSTAECYVLVRAGTLMAVEEHLPLLEQALQEVRQRSARSMDKIRVVFEGGFCEQPPVEFIQVVEEVCYIVDDDFMIGARWFQGDVPEEGDPVEALARSYRDLMSYCSIQHDERRLKHLALLERVRGSGAQAVILCPPKFCEPGLDDQVHFSQSLDTEKIPILSMEFEEKMTSFEQVRIQVETFAESILFYAGEGVR